MGACIYLDYAATAPLYPEAAGAMRALLDDDAASPVAFANPNSLHTPGRDAFNKLEASRKVIAQALGVRTNELVFTGCATEADNAALFGIVSACAKPGGPLPHVVTSSTEHDAVGKAARALEKQGRARVTYVDPDSSGRILPAAVADAIEQDTVLVSIIAVHNETGAINDIGALGAVAHEHGALFHTDAVQALGKVPFNLASLPVDAASFAAHKIGGPKGIGLLYLRQQTPFSPLLHGGGQEGKKRSGTQDVLEVVGFAAAVQALALHTPACEQENERQRALRDRLYEGLCAIKGVHASVPCEAGSQLFAPHIVNVYIDGMESETLVLRFDMAGIAVSGGSACSSRSLDPSGTLLKLGLSRDQALGSLRVSIGRYTTIDDIEACIATCSSVVSS